MAKFKTNKSASKRFKITGRKKILRRQVHQNHFNAKESGNEGRSKKKSRFLPKEFTKNISQIISLRLGF